MADNPGTGDTVATLTEDLRAEHEALDQVVRSIEVSDWERPTPSPGWTIADQIGHLSYFDRTAALAIVDPEAFTRHVQEFQPSMDEMTLRDARSMSPEALLAEWRAARRSLLLAAVRLGERDRVAWYGPSMGARSFLTARLMEAWAHGQDIVDALLSETEPSEMLGNGRTSARLRHVARLGFITRSWSYTVRGATPPDEMLRVELRAPDGSIWVFGPDDASETITGSAEGFCLVVTQRRNVADTDLQGGPISMDWLRQAQAFAGSATVGPPPEAEVVPPWRE